MFLFHSYFIFKNIVLYLKIFEEEPIFIAFDQNNLEMVKILLSHSKNVDFVLISFK